MEEKPYQFEEIIKQGANATFKDFSGALTTTEYQPTDYEKRNWMDYMTSFNDYKKGIDTANAHNAFEKRKLEEIAKKYIFSHLSLMKAMNLLLSNSNISISEFLFEEEYNLNINLEEKNKILLIIYSYSLLISIQKRFKSTMDITKLLLESLSTKEINVDYTKYILSTYVKELLKIIDNPDYNSNLIIQMQQTLNEKEAEKSPVTTGIGYSKKIHEIHQKTINYFE